MPNLPRKPLTVYTRALEFIRHSEAIIARIPPERAWLRDQLHRAAASIALNIGEGAGEFRPKEKARFYRMAVRSATESASVLDVLEVVGAADAGILAAGRAALDEIIAMLVAMCVRLEQRG